MNFGTSFKLKENSFIVKYKFFYLYNIIVVNLLKSRVSTSFQFDVYYEG